MHAKKILQGLMAILLPLLSLSQKSVAVGDTLAPPLFTELKKQAGQSDASLYIITFFSPNCLSSCENIVTNTQLQKQFPQTSFINMTRYKEEDVQGKFTTVNNKPGWQSSDTLFTKAFPFLRVPHIAIINNNGVVRAITNGRHLTVKNIQNLLNDPFATLPLKQDKAYNDKQSLLANLDLQNTPLSNYTFITPFIEGLPGSGSRRWDSINSCTRVTAVNANLPKLYALAFRKWLLRPWQIKLDPAVDRSSWCFEFATPHRTDSIVSQQMLQFLDGHFKTSASFSPQAVQYFALMDTTINSGVTGETINTAQLYKVFTANLSLPYIEKESYRKRTLPASLLQRLEQLTSIPLINQLILPYGLFIASRQTKVGVLSIKSNSSSSNKLQ